MKIVEMIFCFVSLNQWNEVFDSGFYDPSQRVIIVDIYGPNQWVKIVDII